MAVHVPVLLDEVIAYADPKPGQNFVDATVGGGGHARAILKKIGSRGRLVAFDINPDAMAVAAKLGRNVICIHDNFRNIEARVREAAPALPIHGVLFDLGISSNELSDTSLGLSFQVSGPLDMRLSRGGSMTAAMVVNTWGEQDLAAILRDYGQERAASRIARAIVTRRVSRLFTETTDLADVVARTIGGRGEAHTKLHPATKTFQALRIVVNSELDNLRAGLEGAMKLLVSGGRVLAVAFHSLEDRIVKGAFREAAKTCVCPPLAPVCTCGHTPVARLVTKKPITPTPEEIARNPRARSAKLRVIEKL